MINSSTFALYSKLSSVNKFGQRFLKGDVSFYESQIWQNPNAYDRMFIELFIQTQTRKYDELTVIAFGTLEEIFFQLFS